MSKEKLSAGYISSFCMELHLVLRAGMSISQGLSILMEEEKDKYNRGILASLYQKAEQGMPFGEAIKSEDCFPDQVVNMVELGEETGNLDVCLDNLSSYYKKMEEIKNSIKNAVVYPAILFVIMMFVVIMLITKVLPVFKDVLNQIGAVMSPVAQNILNIGLWINSHWYFMLFLTGVIVVLFIYLFATQKGKSIIERLFLKGKIGSKMAVFHFSSAMAMAMKSGLDMDASMDIALKFLHGTTYYNKTLKCKQSMDEGTPMSQALLENDIFTNRYCRMLEVGFKTGAEEIVMAEIASRCEDDVNESIENLIRKIEPAIVIVMTVIVGLILISVMLPLMGIMSSLG